MQFHQISRKLRRLLGLAILTELKERRDDINRAESSRISISGTETNGGM
jgi:hypothetical protein